MKSRILPGVAVTFLLVGSSGAASAATHNYAANITPDQEPSTVLGTHTPTAQGEFTFDDVSKKLCGKVTYTDTTGALTMAHIHQAPTGNPTGGGSPVITLPTNASPLLFGATLDTATETALTGGLLYVNLHTTANPDGEMRGNLGLLASGGNTIACPGATTADAGSDSGADSGSPDAGNTSSSGGSSSGSATGTSSGATTPGTSSGTTTGTSSGAARPGAPAADSGDSCSASPGNAPGSILAIALAAGLVAAAFARARGRR